MKHLIAIFILLSIVSCKSSTDITLDEAYNQMIRTAYYEDEDSLAYYRTLVSSLQSERTKVDSVFTTIHDSIYVEREGLNTNTYRYRDRIIYRTSKETLTQISTLRDSLSLYKSYNQSLLDSLNIATSRNTTTTKVTYRTPWYWRLLGYIGIISIIAIFAYAIRLMLVELLSLRNYLH